MNIFKKFLVALTAAFTAAIIIMPTASAATTMEKSLTAAENPPFTIVMGINYNDESAWDQANDNFRTFSADITDSVSCTFEALKPTNEVGTLVLDTNIKASAYQNVKLDVTGLSVVKAADGSITPLTLDASKLKQSQNANGCIRMNILHSFTQPPVKAYDGKLPAGLEKGDKLVVNFAITGLAPNESGADGTTPVGGAVTTDVTTSSVIADGTTTDGSSTDVSGQSGDMETSSVAQTADPGIIALAATGAAAAALAGIAFTVRKKRK